MLSKDIFKKHNGLKQNFDFEYKLSSFHHLVELPNRRVVDKCSVDIIIPFHGQYDKVRKVVKSILENTRSNPYLITLVDDASPNAEFINMMKQAPQTNCIRLEEQVGFGGALKAGFDATNQPFVCFMHSDVIVKNSSWLERLGNALLNMSAQNVKLVSACSDNTCDVDILKRNRTDIMENVVANEALPLYCALAYRELFKKIGGFIKSYRFAYYENEELYWRMKKFGFQQARAGKSWISHEGEGTIKSLIRQQPEIKKIMSENREICLKDIQELFKNMDIYSK